MAIDWQPTADLHTLKQRAQYLADIRLFFASRGVMEVNTPILSQAAPTTPYVDSLTTRYCPEGVYPQYTYYLQTSPEFAMKRLLAADSGDIYQLASVFRNDQSGRHHTPEFTMLEWYRLSFTLPQLMDEVAAFLKDIFNVSNTQQISYRDAFKRYANIDVLACSDSALRRSALTQIPGLADNVVSCRNDWCELLMSYMVAPQLAKLASGVFVYNFPSEQAQLANIVTDSDGYEVSERFELYINGIETANGYNELLNAGELRQRFACDNQKRRQQHKVEMPIDGQLLAAYDHGLPECAGVAVGLDRLLMIVLGKTHISAVQSFNFVVG